MSLKDEIQDQIKLQIRTKIAESQPENKSIGGFFSNLKSDVANFAKGIVGLGRKAFTDPVESAKTVGATVGELAIQTGKGIPSFLQEVKDIVTHPVEKVKQVKSNISSLRNITYDEQKEMFDELQKEVAQKVGKEGRGKRTLAMLGAGLFSDVAQEITHPIEFSYDKPFTFGLDVMSAGGGKLLGTGAKALAATSKGQKTIRAIEKVFVPNAKLKQAGFGTFADDLVKTNHNIFNSQQKIIESTSKKFEKEFRLNKTDRFEFFDVIDKLRRDTTGAKAVSNKPKIQVAIDWWINDEVPRIQRASGLPKEKAITNYLHHFFPEKLKSSEVKLSKPTKLSSKGFLKKSTDATGFSKDPIVSISAIKSKMAAGALKDAFIQRTVNKFGKNIEALKNELKGTIGVNEVARLEDSGKLIDRLKSTFNLDEYKPGKGTSNKAAQGSLLPKEIAEELNKFGIGKDQNLLFSALDVFNRNWKPLATSIRPRFNTRNVVGNFYNSVVVGGSNPLKMPQAAWQQLGNYINDVRKSATPVGRLAKKMFPRIKGTKEIKMAIEDGVIGNGFFGMDLYDLGRASENSDSIINMIKRYKNPSEVHRVPILRQWLQTSKNIGTAIEDNARLSLYMDRLNKGFSRKAAKDYVNKHLFDYMNGLSETDKVIKKLAPFWSWTRFNIPLQTEAIVTQSLKNATINKLAQPWVTKEDHKDEFRKFLTEKEKESGLLKVGETEKNGETFNKYVRTESVLPVSDLVRIVDIMRLDLDAIGVNPLLGLLNRLKSNRGYFGNLIERFPGEEKKFLKGTFTGKTIERLKIIPFLTELNKAIGGSATEKNILPGGVRLEQVLSPLGTTLKSQEDLEIFGLLEKERVLKGSYESGLEGLYKKYLIKSATEPGERVFKNNVEQLEKLLKKEGLTELNFLPLKIKAMKASIQQQIQDEIKSKIEEKQSQGEVQE